MDSSTLTFCASIGGAMIAASSAFYVARLNRRSVLLDRAEEERAAIYRSKTDDLANFRRELINRIAEQDKKISQLQIEVFDNQKKIILLESQNQALENLIKDTVVRLESILVIGIENIPKLKDELEKTITELRALIKSNTF